MYELHRPWCEGIATIPWTVLGVKGKHALADLALVTECSQTWYPRDAVNDSRHANFAQKALSCVLPPKGARHAQKCHSIQATKKLSSFKPKWIRATHVSTHHSSVIIKRKPQIIRSTNVWFVFRSIPLRGRRGFFYDVAKRDVVKDDANEMKINRIVRRLTVRADGPEKNLKSHAHRAHVQKSKHWPLFLKVHGLNAFAHVSAD